jgi:hypothetical protein
LEQSKDATYLEERTAYGETCARREDAEARVELRPQRSAMKHMLRGGKIAIVSHIPFLTGILSYERYADKTLAAPAEL